MSSPSQPTSGRAVRATVDAYSLVDALPAGPEQVAPGTSLLVSGPPMVGKRDLVVDLMAAGGEDGNHAVFVTTDEAAGRLLDAYEALSGGHPAYAVDCAGVGDVADDRIVDTVGSPSDLTGVGMGIVKAARVIGNGASAGVRLATISVSTLLQYTGSERVFHFLHALTGRFSQAGYMGVFTLDPTGHDQRAVSTVGALFDSRVDLRETDGGRELRVRGLPDASGEWREWPRD